MNKQLFPDDIFDEIKDMIEEKLAIEGPIL